MSSKAWQLARICSYRANFYVVGVYIPIIRNYVTSTHCKRPWSQGLTRTRFGKSYVDMKINPSLGPTQPQRCHPKHLLQVHTCDKAERPKQSHVAGIIVACILVTTTQDRVDGDSGVQYGSEIRPGGRRAGSRVVIFAKQDVIGSRVVIVPYPPSLPVDDSAQGGVLEDNTSIGSPWAAQIVRAGRHAVPCRCRYIAVVEDVV